MAVVIGGTDSLSRFLGRVNLGGAIFFDSLAEVQRFENNFDSVVSQARESAQKKICDRIEQNKEKYQQLLEEFRETVDLRKIALQTEMRELIGRLNRPINKHCGFVERLTEFVRRFGLSRRLLLLMRSFETELARPLRDDISAILRLEGKIDVMQRGIETAIESEVSGMIREICAAKTAINENKQLYFGAIGEEKTLSALKQLPDSFTVINDFSHVFCPPIYNRNTGDYICSIQVDHVVIGPTGLFIIETKNWSKETAQSGKYFSPCKQLERSNFALFVKLNGMIERGEIPSFTSDSGCYKLSPRQVLVTDNGKWLPDRNRFVSVVNAANVVDDIINKYPVFNSAQTEELTGILGRIESRPCTTTTREARQIDGSSRHKSTALLCALLLGMLGAHRFYAGKIGTGLIMMMLTLSFVGVYFSVVWVFIDCVTIAIGRFKDGDGNMLLSQ